MSARPRARPWGDYVLRVGTCVLLFATGYVLLSRSAFALRMRDDAPPFIPGLSGPDSIALVVAFVLALVPLLSGRRFLGALVASSFLLAGIGGYWWTLIPWDEYLTESNFPALRAPGLLEYLLVVSPVFLVASYAVASRYSRMRADYLARGADRDEAAQAAAASFLAGGAAIVLSTVLAVTLAWLLSSGALKGIPQIKGVPAVALAGLVAFGGYVLATRGFGKRASQPPASLPQPGAHSDVPGADRRSQNTTI